VYDTNHYKLVGNPLQGHDLTVTRICFSPDDRHILTVSRDRSWRLFIFEEGCEYLEGIFGSLLINKFRQHINPLLQKKLMDVSFGTVHGQQRGISSPLHLETNQ